MRVGKDKTDAENFAAMQVAVLEATKKAIEENVVGLPVDVVAAYLHQCGGFFYEEGYGQSGPAKPYPFRLRVRSIERPDIVQAKKVRVVEQVLGWG